MVPEMVDQWPGVEVREAGALDDLSADELRALAPIPGDEVLTSRLRDGTSVVMSRELILDAVQRRIADLEDSGADAVLLACTGVFPEFTHRVPVLYAGDLIQHGVIALTRGSSVGVLCPLDGQRADSRSKFAATGPVVTAVADPYRDGADAFVAAATSLKGDHAGVIVLDCMGYTVAQAALVRETSGRPVILARRIVARLSAELVAS